MADQNRMRLQRTETIIISNRERTVSSLLIPSRLYKKLEKLMYVEKLLMSVYLRELLRIYKMDTLQGKVMPVLNSVKRRYQAPGQELVRVDFRPENRHWIELGMIAQSLGISRCYLFTILIQIDMGLIEAEGDGVQGNYIKTYDLYHPEFLEVKERYYPAEGRLLRRLRSAPRPIEKLSPDDWVRFKVLLGTFNN